MATYIWVPVYDKAFSYTMGNNKHGWQYLSPEDGRISTQGVPWSSLRDGDVVKIIGHGYATTSGHVCWNHGSGDKDEDWTTWTYDQLAFEFASHFGRGMSRPKVDIHLQFCWSAEGGLNWFYLKRKGYLKDEPPSTKLLAMQRTDSLVQKFAGVMRHLGFEGCKATGFYGEVLNNKDFGTTVVEKVDRNQYISGDHEQAPNIKPFALAKDLIQNSQGWYFKSPQNQKFFATMTQASKTVQI